MINSHRKAGSQFGKHKIFLGYASGVGKTHAMLEEAHRRRSRGQDVVVGIIESRGRQPVIDLENRLDRVPPKVIDGRPELDVEAVISRRPEVVLVDDLQLDNAPGSTRRKRWQDVQELLSAGIRVLSTVNVQHLESLSNNIHDIIGVAVTETVPDQVLHEADEVEYIDLTPRALLNRLDRGDIYSTDQLNPDIAGLFREGNLSALRAIAMREAANCVGEDIAEMEEQGQAEPLQSTQDKVMICISPTRSALRLIRRGWRMGRRMQGEVLAVYVEEGPIGERERKILDEDFKLAERLGIKTFTLSGELAPSLIEFAKEWNVAQIILGHAQRNRMQEILKPPVLTELVKALRAVDILVVSTESAPEV
jgi:two-component system sensor histidine kinase KdpD